MAFSTFGPNTLHELRSAWAQVDEYNHVNHFLDVHDVGDALVHAGLVEPVLDVERNSRVAFAVCASSEPPIAFRSPNAIKHD